MLERAHVGRIIRVILVASCNVLYYFIKHVCLCPADDQTNYYIISIYDIACVWQQLSDDVL